MTDGQHEHAEQAFVMAESALSAATLALATARAAEAAAVEAALLARLALDAAQSAYDHSEQGLTRT